MVWPPRGFGLLRVRSYQVITDRDAIGEVRGNVYSAVLDYLAAGIAADRMAIPVRPEPAWPQRRRGGHQLCTATVRNFFYVPHQMTAIAAAILPSIKATSGGPTDRAAVRQI
ncbi:hypothetical protein EU244_030675 [Rhodococcus qingshengii]|uniref:hypothetical protein n=1 Tax=Rhodococcus qingshengii TaxID=334542 RepID=UPI0010A5A980|nr:hypothetical protein [Rhodococcus qingshengii]THJ65728.1 hypothetical protein EU244_29035 [Rhodococcus qingshengii]